MKRLPLFVLTLGLLLGTFARGEDAPIPAKDRIVVLISIDGFPAWLWNDPTLPVPNLRRLAAEGATADAMTVSNPSITWINHTTLVTGVNHANGPGSQASYTAFAYADRLVGDILAALTEAGLKDKATVVIATDHGFKKVAKLVYPNVVLRKAGLVQVDKEAVSACDAYVMSQGGMAFVYVTDPARRDALLPQLRELFTATEGVDRVMDGTDGPTMGMPLPSENTGMGDLVLFAKAGYAFQGKFDGEEPVVVSTNYLGTHGCPSTDPQLDGAFIAWGYGIKPGTRIPRIANLDIAPTLAELLGVKLPNPDGRVLREILK